MPSNLRVELCSTELKRIRYINGTHILKKFSSNMSHWELLMIIYNLNGNPSYGINDYIDKLQTMRTTRLTLQNFIKDRVNDGSLIVVKSAKKSRKTLSLSALLADELNIFIEWQFSELHHQTESARQHKLMLGTN